MSLRERINESILHAIHDVETAEPYSGYPDRDDHVDAILAAVRDALLAPEAVEAALDGWEAHHLAQASNLGAVTRQGRKGMVINSIDAALDAAGITEADDE